MGVCFFQRQPWAYSFPSSCRKQGENIYSQVPSRSQLPKPSEQVGYQWGEQIGDERWWEKTADQWWDQWGDKRVQ